MLAGFPKETAESSWRARLYSVVGVRGALRSAPVGETPNGAAPPPVDARARGALRSAPVGDAGPTPALPEIPCGTTGNRGPVSSPTPARPDTPTGDWGNWRASSCCT